MSSGAGESKSPSPQPSPEGRGGRTPLNFEVIARDGPARRGRVTTRHGSFDTPAFMPVGTQGSIKGVLPDHVAATGSQIILANTYHLMLRPGSTVVRDL